MGLDVTAYKGLVMAKGNEAFDDTGDLKDDESWVTFYVNDEFPGRADEIEDRKAYKYSDSFDFRAGSYSGYNLWRELLASMAGLGAPAEVWRNPQPGPFVELVNFSDCEGVIGTSVSAKLAKDFAQFQDLANTHSEAWFRSKYSDWRKAFEMASDNGAVKLH